jgi:hypothetical protein
MTYPPLDEQECSGCHYWRRWATGSSGHCRRHAPAPIIVSDNGYGNFRDESISTNWPEACDDDWCGEWRPKE